ncbi:MAG: hypothetical protein AAF564_23380 [Bacteroidota bacterium]
MSFFKRLLPTFRTTYLLIGGLYILLSANILLRGVSASMEPFGVPAALLDSPYYENAIWWVYTHMLVLGMVMCVIGQFAENMALKLWISRALLVAHLYYTYLDFQASDSVVGTALYKGPASVIPAIIALIATIFLARFAFSIDEPAKS